MELERIHCSWIALVEVSWVMWLLCWLFPVSCRLSAVLRQVFIVEAAMELELAAQGFGTRKY